MDDNDSTQRGWLTPDPGDAVNTDLTSSVGAEDLDEDRLQQDPLEEGMDPPEQWSASDRFGITAAEQRDGESLDQRLDQEEPDPALAVGSVSSEGSDYGEAEQKHANGRG